MGLEERLEMETEAEEPGNPKVTTAADCTRGLCNNGRISIGAKRTAALALHCTRQTMGRCILLQ